jgi:hypothetical protein
MNQTVTSILNRANEKSAVVRTLEDGTIEKRAVIRLNAQERKALYASEMSHRNYGGCTSFSTRIDEIAYTVWLGGLVSIIDETVPAAATRPINYGPVTFGRMNTDGSWN